MDFAGVAVVVDDEVMNEGSEAYELAQRIEEEDSFVVRLTELPSASRLKALHSVSYVVLDWNLIPNPPGTTLPKTVRRANEQSVIQFVLDLAEVRFAPVFIFTNEDIDGVTERLQEQDANLLTTHQLLVSSKKDVLSNGVSESIEDWMRLHAGARFLHLWHARYRSARNNLFRALHNASDQWLEILAKTFDDDGVDPSSQLGSLIFRNLESTLDFRDLFDNPPGQPDAENSTSSIVSRVLTAERFAANDLLTPYPWTGDVFKKNKKYFLNIRPPCDCISRDGADIDLYLLKGQAVSKNQMAKTFRADYGQMEERSNTATIFKLHDNKTVRFSLKDLSIEKWSEWKEKREGRLLHPFLTYVQQRYSLYLQRAGLPRIPKEAVPEAGN